MKHTICHIEIPAEDLKRAELRGFVAYIFTDDIEAELEKIVRLGGAKVSERMPLGEDDSKGWVALFRDPEGNLLELHQRK